jgi:hypothetical protein
VGGSCSKFTIIEVEFMERHSYDDISQRFRLESAHLCVANSLVALVVATINDIDKVLSDFDNFL